MRKVRQVQLGNYTLGDGNIRVQSMLNVASDNIIGNVEQAVELYNAGCEILRIAIPNENAIKLIPAIKSAVPIPLVADIHFDYRLALGAIEAGIDKIRINPGNIGSDERVEAVVSACKKKNIPIRIGVNSGSIEKEILNKYHSPTPQAMVESALYHVHLLEKFDFHNIVISMKSSNVKTTIDAFRLLACECDYPLHIGVTEAGTAHMGLIKNAIGIGSLLCDSIGDTIRVSLTANPLEEVNAGFDILKAIGLCKNSPQIVSCPTCGRTQIDLISLANSVEERLKNCKKNITVSVMGCVVNGPGEAKEADIGIAGGKNCGVIFKKGKVIKTVPESEILDTLMAEIEKL